MLIVPFDALPARAVTMKSPECSGSLFDVTRTMAFEMAVSLERHDWEDAEDYPGIDFWTVELCAESRDGAGSPVAARIAAATLVSVDNSQCIEPGYELDNISYDLGILGGAIDGGHRALLDQSVGPGTDTHVVIADTVVVDERWRGHGLGPAIVLLAAEMLDANGILLSPAALKTRLDQSGQVVANYSARRGDAYALNKVEMAWKKAGFAKLTTDVAWRASRTGDGANSRRRIDEVASLPRNAATSAWWRRRTQGRAFQSLGQRRATRVGRRG